MSKEQQIDYIVDSTVSHSSSSFETRFRKIFTGDSYRSGFKKSLEEMTDKQIDAIENVIISYVRLKKDLKDTEKRLGQANKAYEKLNNEARRNKNTVDSLNFMIHNLHPIGDEY